MNLKLIIATFLIACGIILFYYLSGDKNQHRNQPDSIHIDSTEVVSVLLGESQIKIVTYVNGTSKIVYFNMHDNENTAVEAAKTLVANFGGYLVELQAQGERLIAFTLDRRKYTFDPNRIFTQQGIKKTLERYSQYSLAADLEIQRFAKQLLKYVLTDSLVAVVAVHNNTDGNYSIESYLSGGRFAKDAQAVFAKPNLDPDDFFIVTQNSFFESFRSEQQNVMLQDNQQATDDGSLSVYCGKKGIPYINVEAQYGHLDQQIEMLRKVELLAFRAKQMQ